jgi:hypothetical protein
MSAGVFVGENTKVWFNALRTALDPRKAGVVGIVSL